MKEKKIIQDDIILIKNHVKLALFADLLYIIGTNWGMHLRMYI